MGRRAASPLPDTAPWCGRIAFPVPGVGGGALGNVDLAVHRDTVEVHWFGRRLAVCDRDRLRRWIKRPITSFREDDVSFHCRRSRYWIQLDTASSPVMLPVRVVANLREVL